MIPFVIAGLDPAIHLFRTMDHRVSRCARPGDDEKRIVIDDKRNDFFQGAEFGLTGLWRSAAYNDALQTRDPGFLILNRRNRAASAVHR